MRARRIEAKPIKTKPIKTKPIKASALSKRPSGFMLVDTLMATALAGAIAGVSLGAYQHYEALTQDAVHKTTVAAFKTALRLQYSKWLVGVGVGAGETEHSSLSSLLYFSAQGIPSGVDREPSASQADCEAIWQVFVEQPFASSFAELNISVAHSSMISPPTWQVTPKGYWCEYRYNPARLLPRVVRYHTQTGEVATL